MVGLGRRALPTSPSPAGGYLPKDPTFNDEPLDRHPAKIRDSHSGPSLPVHMVGLGRRARPTLSSPAGGYLPKDPTFHDEPLTAIRRKSGTATAGRPYRSIW
jgi:hypothetical protein